VDGSWAFDWTLQGDNNTTKIATEKTLGDTDAKVTSVEISPISVKAVIETDTDTFTMQTGEASDSFPWLLGVKYKDGTLDAYCLSGGQNERDGNFITQLSATQRIMDVDEIEGLLFKKRDVLEGQTVTEDDVYVVPIR
jgi:hypothetical protein